MFVWQPLVALTVEDLCAVGDLAAVHPSGDERLSLDVVGDCWCANDQMLHRARVRGFGQVA